MEELVLTVKYNCKPGMREAFLRTLVDRGIVTAIRSEDGCLCYDYYLSVQDENVILLVERWQSEAQQRAHMQQPHMAELMAIKETFVDATVFGAEALR